MIRSYKAKIIWNNIETGFKPLNIAEKRTAFSALKIFENSPMRMKDSNNSVLRYSKLIALYIKGKFHYAHSTDYNRSKII